MKTSLVAVLYFLTAKLGLELGTLNGYATLIWPPTGLSLAVLVLGGLGMWPGIFVGALTANLWAGAPIVASIAIGTGNTLEAVVAASLLRIVAFDPNLKRIKDIFALVVLAALTSTILSATIGSTALLKTGAIPPNLYRATWQDWWVGDIMGDLLVAPFLMTWGAWLINGESWQKSLRSIGVLGVLERAGMVILVALAAIAIFTNHIVSGPNIYIHPYDVFPILMVVAIRLNPRWTAAAALLVAVVSIGATEAGQGPFLTSSKDSSLLQAQFFLAVLSITKLVLAGSIEERRQRDAEKKRSDRAAAFLITATQSLSESIDYKTTLRRISEAPVPEFADWCLAYVLNPDGTLHPEISSVDPRTAAVLTELSAPAFTNGTGPSIVAEIFRTEKPRLVQNANDELYLSISKNSLHLALLRKLGFKTLVGVPMFFHNRVLGAILVGSAREDTVYGPLEAEMFDELARRAAIAFENAKLYKDAREAISARDEFLSVASHELRTPLTSLSLQLQAFDLGLRQSLKASREKKAGPDAMIQVPLRVAQIAENAKDQCSKLALLLDDLMDLTRIRLGRLHLTFERVNLSQIVRDVVNRSRIEAGRSHIEISLQVDEDLFGVWDRVRIEQVVSNLISNAIKYGERRPIEVVAKRLAPGSEGTGAAQLSVLDRGLGIAPEMRKKIFERFERGGVNSERISGLGLGLYIVRQIVDAHQGTIHVESRMGQGSIFRVTLPLSVSKELETGTLDNDARSSQQAG